MIFASTEVYGPTTPSSVTVCHNMVDFAVKPVSGVIHPWFLLDNYEKNGESCGKHMLLNIEEALFHFFHFHF